VPYLVRFARLVCVLFRKCPLIMVAEILRSEQLTFCYFVSDINFVLLATPYVRV
jgi:hypothetical protein